MSIPITILQPDGTLLPAPWKAHSLDQVAQLEPSGFYTVMRTFHGNQVVMFDAHLDRIEESARLEGHAHTLDRPALRSALRGMLQQAGYAESRIRITVPRDEPGNILLAIEPLKIIPPQIHSQGVHAATVAFSRENPRAKTNYWLSARRQAQEQLPEGVYEGLILDGEGQVLEGLSSNFYAIQGGVLHTSDEGVLRGIARHIVLEVAGNLLPIAYKAIRLEQIPHLEEAFFSSSSRGVIPIVSIDAIAIGRAKPGPLTLRIHAAYEAWVQDHLEPM